MTDPQHHLLEQVTALIEAGDSLQIDLPVDTGLFVLDPQVLASIRSLLGEVMGLLTSVTRYFEAQELLEAQAHEGLGDSLSLADLAADLSTELASREIADLASIGRNDLHDATGELDTACEQGNFWQVASAAGSTLGRIGRALIPLETALREIENLPPMRRRWEDLDDSLEIRHQYGQLWRSAQKADPPKRSQLPQALALMARRIAKLRQHPIYPFLRIDDRLTLRKLQKRIFTYLAEGDGADLAKGRRLWNETLSTFQLLMQINNRQELRDHDRDLVLTGYMEIRRARYSDAIPKPVLSRLEPLIGRDEALDRVLLHPADHCPADCLVPLDRLRNELLASSSTSFRI